MSNHDHLTDILLPQARIDVFSHDSETIASAALVQEDWRFARVDLAAYEGSVETAVERYKSKASPDLLIIQTETIDDAFTEQLGALSEFCSEGTAAIIVGPVNDVYLYRRLIDMGVSDYLVKPIKSDVLSDVIAKALIARLGVSDSRLIAFVGANGGAGASSFAQVSAWICAEQLGHKTLLMDGAGGWSSASVAMGFDPSASLRDVVRAIEARGEDALDRMIVALGDKLSVVASGADAMLDAGVEGAQYEAALNHLMVKFPVVLVDLSGAEPDLKKTVLTRAHHIVAVATPNVTSLRFCRSLLKEIAQVRGGASDDVSLILNRVGMTKAHEVGLSDIEEAMEMRPELSIPFMPGAFMKHEAAIKGFISDKETSAVVSGLFAILQKTVDDAGESPGEGNSKNSSLIGGFLSKFSS